MIFKTITSFPIPLRSIQRSGRKSRRDETLLTVDFNLRTRGALRSPRSPAGTTLRRGDIMSSLRDFWGKLFRLLRWLKPPVNKVSSLRDFSPLAQHYYSCLFFIPKYLSSEEFESINNDAVELIKMLTNTLKTTKSSLTTNH